MHQIPQLNNHGNYIVSLGNVCRWLGSQAEDKYGVEIYPGIAATEVLYDERGHVKGIATGDVGLDREGRPKSSFARGMELHARVTLFAEGCRGSLTKGLVDKFKLRDANNFQTYGIGIKEVRIVLAKPLAASRCCVLTADTRFHYRRHHHHHHRTCGGSSCGALIPPSISKDWCRTRSAGRWILKPTVARSSTTWKTAWCRSASSRPSTTRIPTCRPTASSRYLTTSHCRARAATLISWNSPQRWKHHDAIRPTFEGGECISYGARYAEAGAREL